MIARILEMNIVGISPRAIASTLNTQVIPAKKGGIWHASTIRYLLANELHCQ